MQELHPGDQTWYISEDGNTLEKLPFLGAGGTGARIKEGQLFLDPVSYTHLSSTMLVQPAPTVK